MTNIIYLFFKPKKPMKLTAKNHTTVGQKLILGSVHQFQL